MNECQELKLDQLGKYLEQQAYAKKIPLKGTFELTARCNFNCNMCYVHLNEKQIKSIGRELTNEQWLDIARQAKDAGMLYLTLTGGEVFARPGFRELYEKLSEMGFLIYILSNGYLIDEKVIEWLGDRPPSAIRFTLYGG
jgi:MoaA/NifB/PqqE/SkfB family radical SAM enzyme